MILTIKDEGKKGKTMDENKKNKESKLNIER